MAQNPGVIGGYSMPRGSSAQVGAPMYSTVPEGQTIAPGQTIMPGQMMNSGPIEEVPMTSGPPMMEGDGMMMQGPPMTGRGPDGFTNPYCNDCTGCGCGGPACSSCDSCSHRGGGCFSHLFGGCGCGSSCGSCGQCGSCGECESSGGCESCNECGCGSRYGRPWILAPFDFVFGGLARAGAGPDGSWWWGQDLTVFAGVHDFRNPIDAVLTSNNSNFGFQEGMNFGMPIWHTLGLDGQIGFEVTQSDLAGTVEDTDTRNQFFLTAGLFHRPHCGEGLQYGLVYDWLHDEYFENFDVAQLRGELSWVWNCRNDIGFWFATGISNSDSRLDLADRYEAIDQYNFFYRRRFCGGGDARVWGGFTGSGLTPSGGTMAGLIGADFEVPIARGFAFEGGFNYLIPSGGGNRAFSEETWNLGCNLVWYFGANAPCFDPDRPLFDVADNGSFMTTLRGRRPVSSN